MIKPIPCNLAAAIIYVGALSAAFAQPHITTQPTDHSVSLGAYVTNLVSATTVAAPLSYQWRTNDVEIAGATNRTLILTNIQLPDAGGYSVLVTDTSGSVTSRVATLDVDPMFTMITTGPVVTDVGLSVGLSWGDYDNDGFPDLFVGRISGVIDSLYRNRGDGTFEHVLPSAIGGAGYGGGAWGDYDNDGFLDLYTVSARDFGSGYFTTKGTALCCA